MDLYNENIDCEKFKKIIKITCYFCDSEITKDFTTYIYDKKIVANSCIFCHIVYNFKKEFMGCAFLVVSKMSQVEINNEYNIYANKYYSIQIPPKIDSHCQYVPINILQYALLDSDIKKTKLFNNFKVMFTSNCYKYLYVNNLFSQKIKKPIYNDISYVDIESYKLCDDQINIINNANNNEIQLIKNIADSIKKEHKNVDKYKKLKCLLLANINNMK